MKKAALLGLVLLGCGAEQVDGDDAFDDEAIAQRTDPLYTGRLLYEEDFEDIGFGAGASPAPYDKRSSVQTCEKLRTCTTNSLATVSARSRTGSKSLRVRLVDGDEYEPKKSRAELSFRDLVPNELDTSDWYGISVLVPLSWEEDPDEQKVVVQFAKGPHSPGSNPILGLRITGGDWQLTREVYAGKAPTELLRHPLRRGRWTDWVFNIRWSPSGKGRTRVWCNGEQIFEDEAQNMHPRTSTADHAMKIGLYGRFTGRVREREIYFDSIRVARGPRAFKLVDPAERRP